MVGRRPIGVYKHVDPLTPGRLVDAGRQPFGRPPRLFLGGTVGNLLQHRQASRGAERVGVERPGMRHPGPAVAACRALAEDSHHVGAADQCSAGQAAAQYLRQDGQIRGDAQGLLRTTGGDAKAADRLIEDQRRPRTLG